MSAAQDDHVDVDPEVRGWRAGRVVALLALLVVLAVAGVVSGFASSSPDGLESVAEQQGFADRARTSDAVGPFDGYATAGDDSRTGTAVAGLAGAATVLVLAGGLAWLVRRRPGRSASSSPSTEA